MDGPGSPEITVRTTLPPHNGSGASGAKPRVGVALYGDLTFDSRVRKISRSLREAGYDVVVACLEDRSDRTDLPVDVTVLPVRPPGWAVIPGAGSPFKAVSRGRVGRAIGKVVWLVRYVGGLRAWGKSVVRAAGDVAVWHSNDLTGLVAVLPHAGRARVVYDSHELFVGTGTALRLPSPVRRLIAAYERRLARRAAAVVTVNEAVAEILARRFDRPVRAIHNCPDPVTAPSSSSRRLRAATGIPESSPVILYHGVFAEHRGIEQLMRALLEPGLERAQLVLLGYGELRNVVMASARDEQFAGRIHVLDPVPPAELLDWVASADVGAMPIQPTEPSFVLSTPNKLFECLAAGVPVVCSDFPASRHIVLGEAGPLGVVCDPTDVAAIGAALRSILDLAPDQRLAMRERCRRAAFSRWNWAAQAGVLRSIYAAVAPLPASSQPADPPPGW